MPLMINGANRFYNAIYTAYNEEKIFCDIVGPALQNYACGELANVVLKDTLIGELVGTSNPNLKVMILIEILSKPFTL